MRTSVEWDDACIVSHLMDEHDVTRSLHNLYVVVVGAGHPGEIACDAPVPQTELLGVGGAVPSATSASTAHPSRLREWRNPPVRGIHDERRTLRSNHLASPVVPKFIVGNNNAADAALSQWRVLRIALLSIDKITILTSILIPFKCGRLLVRQHPLSGKAVGPL